MKSRTRYALFLFLAHAVLVTASAAALTREEAIQQARDIAVHSTCCNEALQALVGILETAKGNIEPIVKCALAIASCGSNTPIIEALASAVAQRETDVEHFDELLVIAMLHRAESSRVESDLRDYVSGRITIEQLRARAQPRLFPVLFMRSSR